MNELEIVERLRRRAGSRGRGVILGIGDDCAIFRPAPGEDVLLKTDQMIEDVHFDRALSPAIVGNRALARSLSDIAAMGGEPRCCLVTLAIPPRLGMDWIDGFFSGLLGLARRTSTTLAGGDLARDPDRLHCDVMVCGVVGRDKAGHSKALRRDGARAGDFIYVSGRLGKPWDRRVEPRLTLGRSLIGRASACIDISDGLALDLHRLCVASGVAAEVDRVPLARGANLDRALHGGEDYELLFTVPEGVAPPRGVTRIGRIVPSKRGIVEPGSVQFQGRVLEATGYDHFRHSGQPVKR